MRNRDWKGSGWYNATNTKKFHWFDQVDKPICGIHVKGFPTEFCHSSGNPVGQEPTSINYYTGGCKNCIKKISNKK